MILSGNEIEKQIDLGKIKITPYDKGRLNPASYDLTLGDTLAFYESAARLWPAPSLPGSGMVASGGHLDAAINNPVVTVSLPKTGFLLKPGIGYLAHTVETIWTDEFVPVLDGKSSIGRLFIKVHETAGYGDPNFNGQYTLEVTVVHPVIVYSGMRIAQVRFHTILGEVSPYDGNYTQNDAQGPVASKSWKQIAKDGLLDLKPRNT